MPTKIRQSQGRGMQTGAAGESSRTQETGCIFGSKPMRNASKRHG